MTAFLNSTRAELLRLRKWSAIWVIIGAGQALTLSFGYVFNYVAYKTGDENFAEDGATSAQLLAEVMPSAIPDVIISGLPMFGGALAMVVGALVAGNGFGWGTWKTVFTQGPSRSAAVGGSLAAVTVFVLVMMTATLVLCTGVSVAIAAAEGQSITMPALTDLAQSFGAGFLMLEMWALLGFLVGVLVKGPALAVGLGLVWSLVVENLLRGVGSLLSGVGTVTEALPGTAGGSLAGAIIGGPNGTPGVLDAISGERALVTVTAYVLVAAIAAVVVMRRRDLA
ncbi:ABC transporter permease [Nocardioides panzhihuensis]|uniref:ABC-type transport system involved in multi-copper enzyme maturation permease subunit n=1 Tax=Nocardioides panzhihuensis TaxID=860243 RepID=A0A7Z0DKY9_9ACTN|nr:ABC transporter permease [Nocardioides panzhihuensis]NYI77325.1 ABC-type transport system involved in multi-copper enzyme maturation permease subunit [Nocardioides panzhihuensis]